MFLCSPTKLNKALLKGNISYQNLKKTSLQNKINHAKKPSLSTRGERYLSQPIASEI